MIRVLMTAVVLSAACWVTTSAKAQDSVLTELYGRGVHHYHEGDYAEAHRLLSLAIENGSRDPRAYYYRGLVNQLTGRTDEARSDWRQGAQIEASGDFGNLVGRSLQRVQGATRMEIEEIRQTARLEARGAQQARNRARYEELREAEAEVLRDRRRAPAPPPVPAAPPVDAGANPFDRDDPLREGDAEVDDEATDPFADDPADTPAQPEPAAPAPDAEDDPFGTDVDDPFDAGDDPFGAGADDAFGGAADDADDDMQPAPAPDAVDDADDDPFGGAADDADLGDDPFGGAADDDAADMEDDPFGGAADDDAADDAGMDEDDPFGDAADDDAEMEDDPFGGTDDEDPFN